MRHHGTPVNFTEMERIQDPDYIRQLKEIDKAAEDFVDDQLDRIQPETPVGDDVRKAMKNGFNLRFARLFSQEGEQYGTKN